MNVVVPFSRPLFSPHYFWAHVPEAAVQEHLRHAFSRWGLPGGLRVDNGTPWGSWSDLPPTLALWLLGLGIEMVWNPPRQPQKNGVVERSQGTGKRWAEPHTCASAGELQQRLDDDDRLQREQYPVVKTLSRWQLFPELAHSGRRYRATAEKKSWDLDRVRQHLAGYAVPRKVDCTGQVSLYNRNYYVGVVHAGQTVYVMFDPHNSDWLFANADGNQLRSQPAVEITAERICSLKLTGKK
jgi:transposase InsO family protein